MPSKSKITIVVVSEFFAEGMGYLENLFPKYLARLGADAHVVATDLPLSYRNKREADAYQGFVRPFPAGTVQNIDGFKLHVVGHRNVFSHMRMTGLRSKLFSLRPDVVQTMTPIGWIAVDTAMLKQRLGYKLFSGCHYHSSVFPLSSQNGNASNLAKLHCLITRTIPGRLASFAAEKCYAISSDCADVADQFFGVPRKQIEISPLGVDTEIFHPALSASALAQREAMRREMGFAEGDIVCVYSGRFGEDKNPLLLARAVTTLRSVGEPYRGLFIGSGTQAREIQTCPGCVSHDFAPVQELGALYRAADIGVWPTQESLSMLDAAACGLPIIANHTLAAPERLRNNGLSYRLNDLDDLVRTLLILRNAETRTELGSTGAKKMMQEFSWENVARRRFADYETAMHSGGSLRESKRQGSVG
jgi:glycosyltransferase involved in cell wall biosynthesis